MLIDRGLTRLLNDKEYGRFSRRYDITPEQFIKDYEAEWDIDLTDKVVIVVGGYEDFPEHKYPLMIEGAYFPEPHHNAKITYHGHISFITISKKEDGEVVEILYKDDECPPQDDFNEFVEYTLWDDDDYPDYTGDTLLKTIEAYLRGILQDLDYTITKDKIVILQGL